MRGIRPSTRTARGRPEIDQERGGRSYDVVLYAPWIAPLLGSGDSASPGGAERQMLFLIRALTQGGYSVCVVTHPSPEGVPDEVVGGVDIVPLPPWRPERRLIPGVALILYLVTLGRLLAGLDTLSYVQRTASADTGVVGVVAKLMRRHFVYSSANVVDFDFGRLEPRRRNVWLFHLGIRLADAIVVQTEEQVALCRQQFGRVPELIKSVAEPAPPRSVEPTYFLWVGRAESYKRPEAFVELARTIPDARFKMVLTRSGGAGVNLGKRVEREAANVPNLELLGPRPRSELMKLIDGAVAVINTSDYEGMPNVFLESWARGVPALSLTHDPDGAIERHGLGGFARGSVAVMTHMTRRMWRDRTSQEHLAIRCRAYIQHEHAAEAVISKWVRPLGLAPRNADPSPE